MSKPVHKLCLLAFESACEVFSEIIESAMQAGERAGARGDLAGVEAAEQRCTKAQAALEQLIEEQLAARGETAPVMTDAMLA